jgi:hypothetical protein
MAAARCLEFTPELTAKLEQTLIDGFVGPPALTFIRWLKEQDLPSPVDVLTKGWEPDQDRLDRTYAVYNGLAAYVTGLKDLQRVDSAVLAWRRLESLIEAGLGDMAITPAKIMAGAKLGRDSGDKRLVDACAPMLRYLAKSSLAGYARRAAE